MTQPQKSSPAEDVPSWVQPQMRACIGCGQRDNHPKMLTGALDAPPIYWHHDCYVIAEQPGWEEIRDVIAGAEGVTGHALRLHLMGDVRRGQEAP